MDDKQIVELFFRRDENAIRHTAELYGSRLRALSYRIVEDIQTAEECENDTYIEAWNLIPPHNPEHYLYAFLAKIIRNLSLNCCRNRNRLKRKAYLCELSTEMEQCLPGPDDCACRMDDMAFAEILNQFLAALPLEKRNVFLRRYWYLDSIADISHRFGLSQSKVKTMLHRTRKEFREHLRKEGYYL